jgi:hypothetical protein
MIATGFKPTTRQAIIHGPIRVTSSLCPKASSSVLAMHDEVNRRLSIAHDVRAFEKSSRLRESSAANERPGYVFSVGLWEV